MNAFVPLTVKSVSDVVGAGDVSIVTLENTDTTLCLHIVCSKDVAHTISESLHPDSQPLPQLAQLLTDILRNEAHCSLQVVIDDLQDGCYTTRVVSQPSGNSYPIAVASGILLSVAAHLPLLVTRTLLSLAGTTDSDSNRLRLPITSLTVNMLQLKLQESIDCEDYEQASVIRDELLRRKQ